ncbi:hypothetical protein VST7929_01488 [Vibrio stylophorae]|uniref:SPOR domain-containing protein n=1 Tax=Vibrio stylophorae TaxID=659351 RepID=A0ABM8ZTG8_9VIBR|nr:hypothetical protein [Vibrio stylophorae]CAH0533617.1 hypothetical protein VST7929_01488 [Vibrio stylophorae]
MTYRSILLSLSLLLGSTYAYAEQVCDIQPAPLGDASTPWKQLAQSCDIGQGLWGREPKSHRGSFWLQCGYGQALPNPKVHEMLHRLYPDNTFIIQDTQNNYRCLIGPFTTYDYAAKGKEALDKMGIKTFIREVAKFALTLRAPKGMAHIASIGPVLELDKSSLRPLWQDQVERLANVELFQEENSPKSDDAVATLMALPTQIDAPLAPASLPDSLRKDATVATAAPTTAAVATTQAPQTQKLTPPAPSEIKEADAKAPETKDTRTKSTKAKNTEEKSAVATATNIKNNAPEDKTAQKTETENEAHVESEAQLVTNAPKGAEQSPSPAPLPTASGSLLALDQQQAKLKQKESGQSADSAEFEKSEGIALILAPPPRTQAHKQENIENAAQGTTTVTTAAINAAATMATKTASRVATSTLAVPVAPTAAALVQKSAKVTDGPSTAQITQSTEVAAEVTVNAVDGAAMPTLTLSEDGVSTETKTTPDSYTVLSGDLKFAKDKAPIDLAPPTPEPEPKSEAELAADQKGITLLDEAANYHDTGIIELSKPKPTPKQANGKPNTEKRNIMGSMIYEFSLNNVDYFMPLTIQSQEQLPPQFLKEHDRYWSRLDYQSAKHWCKTQNMRLPNIEELTDLAAQGEGFLEQKRWPSRISFWTEQESDDGETIETVSLRNGKVARYHSEALLYTTCIKE